MSLAVNRSSSRPSPALLLRLALALSRFLSVSTVYGGPECCQGPPQSLPQQATVFLVQRQGGG
jgi:hypothetical protein